MQVTETLAEGLKREFRVVVPAADLGATVDARLDELKDRVRINGFRPGKVPVAHLRRLYGRAVMAETIEAKVREANANIVSDHGFKLAMEPQVTLPSTEDDVAGVMSGKADLAYSVAMEILPKIELTDFKNIQIEKPVAEVADAEVDRALAKIAEQNQPFLAKAEGLAAEPGDKVTVSFTGTINGAPFEGGTGTDIDVLIGSKSFLPGFEEGLIGMRPGETRMVNATFPANYLTAELAGKDAVFEVVAKSVASPQTVTVDDEFAQKLGLESLAKLRDAIKDRVAREHAAISRQRLKRKLLDALDERHKFDLPPTLVQEEFGNVWRTVLTDLQSQGRSFADEGTNEDEAKTEYRTIAERRVRLGLVIAEIGERNDIKVTDEEMQRAVSERARQFPGQEQQVWEYYRNNAAALASLRAPIFEDKVVDFLLELAKVSERTVPAEELYKEEDDDKTA